MQDKIRHSWLESGGKIRRWYTLGTRDACAREGGTVCHAAEFCMDPGHLLLRVFTLDMNRTACDSVQATRGSFEAKE